MSNHPLRDVIRSAEQWIKDGHEVYQKFTCGRCGQRLTIGEVNVFYQAATCDQCGYETDLEVTGCNYLLVINRRTGKKQYEQ